MQLYLQGVQNLTKKYVFLRSVLGRKLNFGTVPNEHLEVVGVESVLSFRDSLHMRRTVASSKRARPQISHFGVILDFCRHPNTAVLTDTSGGVGFWLPAAAAVRAWDATHIPHQYSRLGRFE
ncbi:unnamed protein product, partial [Pylaiella littoralis]